MISRPYELHSLSALTGLHVSRNNKRRSAAGPRVRLLSGVMFVLPWPSQQPSAALIRGPGLAPPQPCGRLRLHRAVYSTTANKPRTKARKKSRGRGGRESDEKQRDLVPGVLVAFHRGGPLHPRLLWRQRAGEGGGWGAFLSRCALKECRLWLRSRE